MNTRPLPSRPSHYVGGILQALAAFLDTQAARSLRDAARLEVAEVSQGLQITWGLQTWG